MMPVVRPAPVPASAFPAPPSDAPLIAAPPPFLVRIGTVEVRAAAPPVPAPASSPAPPPSPSSQGFGDYALLRSYMDPYR
jgi:hypothetical protein